MNKINSPSKKINFFSTMQNLIKKNVKIIIYLSLVIILFIVGSQIYLLYKNNKILDLSIAYNDLKNSNSQVDFNQQMNQISKTKSFYSQLASLELINYKLENKMYNESYEDYLRLLNNNKIDNLYLTLIALHGSYNLLDKINDAKIDQLISYIDLSYDSFKGYRLELLFLLSIKRNDTNQTNSLYNQINLDDNIPLSIKERVKKIYEFKKYN